MKTTIEELEKRLDNTAEKNALNLIHEVDINGKSCWWVEYNGTKVSGYLWSLEDARIFFANFTPIEPKKEVIDSRNV